MRNTSCKFGLQIKDKLGECHSSNQRPLNRELTIWQYATRIHIKKSTLSQFQPTSYSYFWHIDIREQKTACCIHFQPFWKISCWQFFHQPSPKKAGHSRKMDQNGTQCFPTLLKIANSRLSLSLLIKAFNPRNDKTVYVQEIRECSLPAIWDLMFEHWSHQVRTATFRDIYEYYIFLIIADLIRTWWQHMTTTYDDSVMQGYVTVMLISISISKIFKSINNCNRTAYQTQTKLQINKSLTFRTLIH